MREKAFAVGQKWRKRGGDVVTIQSIESNPQLPYPVCTDERILYSRKGEICTDGKDHQNDLVELVSEAPALPEVARAELERLAIDHERAAAYYRRLLQNVEHLKKEVAA